MVRGITQDPWVRFLSEQIVYLYCRLVKFAMEHAIIHGITEAVNAIAHCIANGDRRGKVVSSGILVISVGVICAIFV